MKAKIKYVPTPGYRLRVIQSVKFRKSHWTFAQAKRWLKKYGFKIGRTDETENYYWFRQIDPEQMTPIFRTLIVRHHPGVQLTIGNLKSKYKKNYKFIPLPERE
jgi:hypothetical protein